MSGWKLKVAGGKFVPAMVFARPGSDEVESCALNRIKKLIQSFCPVLRHGGTLRKSHSHTTRRRAGIANSGWTYDKSIFVVSNNQETVYMTPSQPSSGEPDKPCDICGPPPLHTDDMADKGHDTDPRTSPCKSCSKVFGTHSHSRTFVALLRRKRLRNKRLRCVRNLRRKLVDRSKHPASLDLAASAESVIPKRCFSEVDREFYGNKSLLSDALDIHQKLRWVRVLNRCLFHHPLAHYHFFEVSILKEPQLERFHKLEVQVLKNTDRVYGSEGKRVKKVHSDLRIWGWNKESLCSPGALHASLVFCEKNNVDVCFVFEGNLQDPFQFRIRNYLFVYSGIRVKEECYGRAPLGLGTGVWLSLRVAKALMYVVPHSARVCEVMVRTAMGPFQVLGAHAPTETCPDECGLAFWSLVYEVSSSHPKSLPSLLVGDLNMRIHARLTGEDKIFGPYIRGRGVSFLETTTFIRNRTCFVEWCGALGYCHLNSRFQKPTAEMMTFREFSADPRKIKGNKFFQVLDHAATRCHQLYIVRDICARTDVKTTSHHYPLQVDISLRPKNRVKPKPGVETWETRKKVSLPDSVQIRSDRLKHKTNVLSFQSKLICGSDPLEAFSDLSLSVNGQDAVQALESIVYNCAINTWGEAVPARNDYKSWLSDEAIKANEAFVACVHTNAKYSSHTKVLQKRWKKLARRDKRRNIWKKIDNGAWKDIRFLTKPRKYGSRVLKHFASGALVKPEGRGHAFAEYLS